MKSNEHSRTRLPWILAGAVVAALAVLVAAVVYALNDDDVTARWETADTMTSSPWTPSIVKPGAPVDVPGNFVGAADVTSIAGDDCDKEALKKHLASNPRLAQNWAQILGISVAEINGYIDRLQSRRLTVPVQVTNHDYEGDSPRELQSVLDAGTAVLTDADGTPRVRCACGNPLKPAAAKATKFDNLPPGADPGSVVTNAAPRRQIDSTKFPSSPPNVAECGGTDTDAGTLDFVHPTWGPARLFVRRSSRDSAPMAGCIVVVDEAQSVRYIHREGDWLYSRFALATPATDNTGNIFVRYNPGRYDGILTLTPTPTGFAPFANSYSGTRRHYFAEVTPPEPDGRVSIKTFSNDCNPACASGTITTKLLRWNGADYV